MDDVIVLKKIDLVTVVSASIELYMENILKIESLPSDIRDDIMNFSIDIVSSNDLLEIEKQSINML